MMRFLLLIICWFFCLTAMAADATEQRSASPVRTIQFDVLNADCFACRRQIERLLRATPGVIGVELGDASPIVSTVVFDSAAVSRNDLIKVLEQQKYKTRNMREITSNQTASQRHNSHLKKLDLPELRKPRNKIQ
jgi:hypothetical protein